ncbi:MAG: 50S ribosomal protein L6 [Acholeplasmatales bacterium]|jgi:large subunit ribosomal protein L6|nr:50S ribosomal protein L6 [Acholeplasmatales bacterium]
MSRIGNKVIKVPAGVSVDIADGNLVTVKSSKGELKCQFYSSLSIKQEANEIKISRPDDAIFTRKIHGTTRALLSNMIVGLSEGFKKALEIQGVGYRASLEGSKLVLSIGYSHPVEFIIPKQIKVECPKNTDIIITGIDKQEVGEFAAKIRDTYKPEPYKGKGIRYVGEHVRRKAGKTAK